MNSKMVAKGLIGLFILGGILTYSVPLVEVGIPPLIFRWSAWEMTKPVLNLVLHKKPAEKKPKNQFDFVDFLRKILPKNPHSTEQKAPPAMWIGLSAPFGLLFSYLFLILAGLFFLLTKPKLFFNFAVLSFVSSVYSLLTFFYLGHIAKINFAQNVDKYTKKIEFLRTIAQEFVHEMVIRPDRALYLLCIFTFCICITHQAQNKFQK